jgi:hypothetical protein
MKITLKIKIGNEKTYTDEQELTYTFIQEMDEQDAEELNKLINNIGNYYYIQSLKIGD